MKTASTHMQKHTLSNLQRQKKKNVKELWNDTDRSHVTVEWRRTGPAQRREETRENTMTQRGVQQGRREEGGGVSQRIWVLANAALSSADHDNLTIVICFSVRDSRLWVTLAAPIGRIYCLVETSDEARIVTSYKTLWGSMWNVSASVWLCWFDWSLWGWNLCDQLCVLE